MKYAIVESGGKQYKAVEGEFIEVDRLPDEIGKNIKFEQVLFLADGEIFTVGTPVIKDTPIWTRVVEHFRGEKVTTFNYRAKKRIRVKTGHRQNYTRLLVEQIGGSALVKKEPVRQVEPDQEKPEARLKTARKPSRVVAAEVKKSARIAPKKDTSKAAPVKKETKAEPKKTSRVESRKTTPKAATPKKAPAKKTPARKPAAK